MAEATDAGGIVPVAMERAFTPADPEALGAIVAAQRAAALKAGAETIRVVATAYVRDAADRDRLVEQLGDVEVLGEADEARLAFLGAVRMLGPGAAAADEPIGVVDVGGGSTELVTGTPAGGVQWFASFRIGSRMLADAYLRTDPPPAAELARVRRHAEGVYEGLRAPQPARAFAAGGSATSLRRLCGADVLTTDVVAAALELLASAPSAQIAVDRDLDPRRVRLLPAGLILLETAGQALGCPLRVGSGGLREGVCIEILSGPRPDAIL